MNTFEGLARFAPLVVPVHITGPENKVTRLCLCDLFPGAAGVAPLYRFDVPVLKTTAWRVGLCATPALAWQLLVQASG